MRITKLSKEHYYQPSKLRREIATRITSYSMPYGFGAGPGGFAAVAGGAELLAGLGSGGGGALPK